jgi:hypothetical protein
MIERDHSQDRAEATAFLRKALGLERVLDRLRRDGDDRVAKPAPVPGGARPRTQSRTQAAA